MGGMMESNIAGVVVLVGRDTSRGELPIGRRPVVIGRDPWVDIVVHHPSISRHHAMLWAEPGQLFVRDLGASGGTWVGGRLLEAGESCEVGKRQTLGLGGALELRWKRPRRQLEALPTAGRVVLENAAEGWQLLEATDQARTTKLSETAPEREHSGVLSVSAGFLESLAEFAPELPDDPEPATEEDMPAVIASSSGTDEVPTARLNAMGDLLMHPSVEADDFEATASAPALPLLTLEDSVRTGPQQAVGPLRVLCRGKESVVEEIDSGNRTRVRGETRVALLRVLCLRLAAFRAGEFDTPRVSDVDLAQVLWPDAVGDTGPRIELLIRRLQRQLREAGLPQDLVSRDEAGTRLLPTCAVPELPATKASATPARAIEAPAGDGSA